jgi:hypothetical protein
MIDSTGLMGDLPMLRKRLASDGFLLLRGTCAHGHITTTTTQSQPPPPPPPLPPLSGVLDIEVVLRARGAMMEHLAEKGM